MKHVCIKGHTLVQWINVHWNNGSVFRHRSFMKKYTITSGSYSQAGRQVGRQSDEMYTVKLVKLHFHRSHGHLGANQVL